VLHDLPTGVTEALRPASELVSALGSFAASAYYARAIGAAAFRPVRGEDGRAIRMLRVDDGWALTLVVFVVATLAAASLVEGFEHFGGYGVSGHAAFTSVLITTLWPYASGRGGQAALVFFLVLVGAARLLEGAMPAELIGGIAIGIASACAVRGCLPYRSVGRTLRR